MDTPVRIPVCPAEHFFLAFKHKPELQGKKLPNVRDYDSRIYLRQTGSSFLMGVFEKQARPWDVTKHGVDPEWNQIKVYDQQIDNTRQKNKYIAKITVKILLI